MIFPNVNFNRTPLDDCHVIGLMSGTSLDGIDLCYVNFKLENTWSFKIKNTQTIPYPRKWANALKIASNFSVQKLKSFDLEYTDFISKCVQKFCKEYKITKLDALCSHGHTVKHQPHLGFTKQIGNNPELATKLNTTVVCDFRPQDVFLGGQGAPLVPIGDELLFSDYGYCLNLGGFANISFEYNNKRVAFDISPVNIVFNHYVSLIGLSYDKDGSIGASGSICKPLFQQLNDLGYYAKSMPKSLGLEWVEEYYFKVVNQYDITLEDILCTCVEHAAHQISKVIKYYGLSNGLVTGGGVYNSFLIERIQDLSENRFTLPSDEIIEFKEALIFGLMGVLKLKGEDNCLASVTGAKSNHSSGKIFLPKKQKN